jgi:hypothetical protein
MSVRALLLFGLGFLSFTPAHAHEPLWGDSPQTFAFGVRHPAVRLSYSNDYRLLSGGKIAANPTGLRRSRLDTVVSYQYSPLTSLNVRVEVPFTQIRAAQTVGGTRRSTSASGLGDIAVIAKSRLRQRFGEDWKEHQSVIGGLQLPTGSRAGVYPDGKPLGVADRPASGHFGVIAGYAYAYERLEDTIWASVGYRHEFGGRERRGDVLEADLNYGYWIKRATRPQDLGIILSAGPHFEWMGRDRLQAASDPDSGYTMIGIQSSIIVTQGPGQYRLGVMAPLHQRVNGTQLRPEIVVRAAGEWLF